MDKTPEPIALFQQTNRCRHHVGFNNVRQLLFLLLRGRPLLNLGAADKGKQSSCCHLIRIRHCSNFHKGSHRGKIHFRFFLLPPPRSLMVDNLLLTEICIFGRVCLLVCSHFNACTTRVNWYSTKIYNTCKVTTNMVNHFIRPVLPHHKNSRQGDRCANLRQHLWPKCLIHQLYTLKKIYIAGKLNDHERFSLQWKGIRITGHCNLISEQKRLVWKGQY